MSHVLRSDSGGEDAYVDFLLAKNMGSIVSAVRLETKPAWQGRAYAPYHYESGAVYDFCHLEVANQYAGYVSNRSPTNTYTDFPIQILAIMTPRLSKIVALALHVRLTEIQRRTICEACTTWSIIKIGDVTKGYQIFSPMDSIVIKKDYVTFKLETLLRWNLNFYKDASTEETVCDKMNARTPISRRCSTKPVWTRDRLAIRLMQNESAGKRDVYQALEDDFNSVRDADPSNHREAIRAWKSPMGSCDDRKISGCKEQISVKTSGHAIWWR